MKPVRFDAVKDTSGRSAPLHWEHSPEEEEDLVNVLRRLQAQYPVRAVLAAAGAVLVSAGGALAVFSFLRAHPYLPVIALGLVCLAAAAATCSEGLAVYLPASVQHYLLKTTPFDLLHDDAAFLNFIRKWARMLMVCYAGSSGEIENLTRGLDPEFVDMVFNHTMIDFLPIGVRRLLLPERLAENGDISGIHNHVESSSGVRSRWQMALPARKATVRLKQLQQTGKVDAEPEDVTHEAVWNTLCEKRVEVASKYTEPELGPVIIRAIMQSLWCSPLMRLMPNSKFVGMASLASGAFWWGVAALTMYVPSAQSLALRGFSMVGLSSGNRNLHLIRASRLASVLGGLSVGVAIASMAYRRRLAEFCSLGLGLGLGSEDMTSRSGSSRSSRHANGGSSRIGETGAAGLSMAADECQARAARRPDEVE